MSLKVVLSVAAILVLVSCANGFTLKTKENHFRQQNITAFTNKLQRGLDLLTKKNIVGKDLEETLGVLNLRNIFFEELEATPDNDLVCAACVVAANGLINARREDGATREDMLNFANNICIKLHIQTEKVCLGVIELNIDIFLYIVDNNLNVDGARVCSLVLQSSDCKSRDAPTWEIDIHEGKSLESRPGSGESYNILHLTDIHYDPIYQPGSLVNCDHPLCCQYDSGDVEKNEDAAGYWTEWNNCDVPHYLLEDTLQQITEQHNLEYVYYTGDIISHRVWATNIFNNSEDLRYVYGQFRKYFGDIPVFPVMGNHEPHPLNVWAPNDVEQDVSTKWVFDLVAEEWGHWLGDECKETIRAGGYYSKLVRPGLRVVGLNSNVAYINNWWLLYNDVDNFGQLAWLENVLYDAEQNGESVHILSHVPSGDYSAYAYWMQQFYKILARYQNTVTGIFNGHTHNDEMVVYHNEDGAAMKVVAFNGGSLTAFSNRNPNYRIFKVDTTNADLLDYDQYYFDVDEANKNASQSPNWMKHYSFKDAYGVDSLFGEDISGLMEQMAKEPSKELLKQYIFFRNRGGPKSYEACDEECMKSYLSKLVQPYYGENTYSDKLMELWEFDQETKH